MKTLIFREWQISKVHIRVNESKPVSEVLWIIPSSLVIGVECTLLNWINVLILKYTFFFFNWIQVPFTWHHIINGKWGWEVRIPIIPSLFVSILYKQTRDDQSRTRLFRPEVRSSEVRKGNGDCRGGWRRTVHVGRRVLLDLSYTLG